MPKTDYTGQTLTFEVREIGCIGPHDFKLDAKGHECRRCGLREEIVNGQKFVFDPRMPKGELRLVQDGVTIGRITGL